MLDKCHYCESQKFFIEKKGNQTGLYCRNCGRWQKWATKEEIRLINHKNKTIPIDEILNLKNQMEGVVTNTDKERNILWTCMAMLNDLLKDYQ